MVTQQKYWLATINRLFIFKALQITKRIKDMFLIRSGKVNLAKIASFMRHKNKQTGKCGFHYTYYITWLSHLETFEKMQIWSISIQFRFFNCPGIFLKNTHIIIKTKHRFPQKFWMSLIINLAIGCCGMKFCCNLRKIINNIYWRTQNVVYGVGLDLGAL